MQEKTGARAVPVFIFGEGEATFIKTKARNFTDRLQAQNLTNPNRSPYDYN